MYPDARRRNQLVAILILALVATSLLYTCPLSMGDEGVIDAFFEKVEYAPKIYDAEEETFTFYVHNARASEDASGTAHFYLRIYSDGGIVLDEYHDRWVCDRGESVVHEVTLGGWEGPHTYRIQAQLFWQNGTLIIQEDVIYFEILVVRLFVADWSFSPCSAVRGSSAPSALMISFKNGGNDPMFDLSTTVVDPSGLQIAPRSRDLATLPAGETATFTFSVAASESIPLGVRIVSFEISYNDFRKILHTEKASATVTVTRVGTNLLLASQEAVKYGKEFRASAKLTDSAGEAIPDQVVVFYVDRNQIGSGVTDQSGTTTLSWRAGIDIGEHILIAVYGGSAKLEGCNASRTFVVTQASTLLSLDFPRDQEVEKVLVIRALLTDEENTPLEGKIVAVYLDSLLLGEEVTSSSGAISIAYTPKSRGSYVVKALFNGSSNYSPAEATGRFDARPISTSIDLNVQGIVFQGDQITISGVIRDRYGNPIPDVDLNFFLISDETRIVIGTRRTNPQGIASISCMARNAGTTSVEATFEGNEVYDKAVQRRNFSAINLALILGLLIIVFVLTGTVVIARARWNLGRPFGRHARSRTAPAAPPSVKTIGLGDQVREGKGACVKCGLEIPFNSSYCDKCGAKQEAPGEVSSPEDEKVYSYIVEHHGTISWSKAAEELGISVERLKTTTEKLKRLGRLA